MSWAWHSSAPACFHNFLIFFLLNMMLKKIFTNQKLVTLLYTLCWTYNTNIQFWTNENLNYAEKRDGTHDKCEAWLDSLLLQSFHLLNKYCPEDIIVVTMYVVIGPSRDCLWHGANHGHQDQQWGNNEIKTTFLLYQHNKK